MRLLIGYDDSECADSAIDDMQRAGLPTKGEALVVTVAEEWPAYMLAGFDALELDQSSRSIAAQTGSGNLPATDRWSRAAAETAKRAAERVSVLLPGWTVTSAVHSSSPYSALLRVADEWKADLLLVGSHGRSAMGRALFGSVSHFIVNHATCSVRIARCPLFVSDAPERLLIGLDGSEDSLVAVEEVAQRTWPKATEVRVITALDHRFLSLVPTYDFPLPRYNEPVDQEIRKAVKVAAARACARLTSAGLNAHSFLRDGDPKYVLLEEAEKWQADCIFLGARGHSALERFLIGSVSASVALHSRTSVEIVRPRSAN